VIEEDWGEMPRSISLSRDPGARIHYRASIQRGEESAVVINGQVGPFYNEIDRVSSDSSLNHVAYWARKGPKWVMVFDGQEGTEYDHTPISELANLYDPLGAPVFSADGSRLAYVGQKGSKYVVVVDGKEGPEFALTTQPVFSSDARRFGYLAAPSNTRLYLGSNSVRNGFAVVDGVEGPQYEAVYPIEFTPDARHATYAAKRRGKFLVVVDGKESPEYDELFFDDSGSSPLKFSPVGSRFAYVAARNGRWFVVADGVEGTGFSSAPGNLVFSPDGRHLAYAASDGSKSFVVLDGNRLKEYDGPLPELQHPDVRHGVDSLVFSPDSRRFAYWANKNGKAIVVVDGKEGPEYSGKVDSARRGDSPPVFSPDSQHLAYAAYKGGSGGQTMIQQGSSAYWGIKGAKSVVVVDDVEGSEFDAPFLTGSGLVSMDPVFDQTGENLAYCGVRNGRAFTVLNGMLSAPHDLTRMPTLSSRGGVLAYVAQDGGREAPVVADLRGSHYDEILGGMRYLPPSTTFSNGAFQFIAKRNLRILRVTQPIPTLPELRP
jgi:Tol biopolymer transport system component